MPRTLNALNSEVLAAFCSDTELPLQCVWAAFVVLQGQTRRQMLHEMTRAAPLPVAMDAKPDVDSYWGRAQREAAAAVTEADEGEHISSALQPTWQLSSSNSGTWLLFTPAVPVEPCIAPASMQAPLPCSAHPQSGSLGGRQLPCMMRLLPWPMGPRACPPAMLRCTECCQRSRRAGQAGSQAACWTLVQAQPPPPGQHNRWVISQVLLILCQLGHGYNAWPQAAEYTASN